MQIISSSNSQVNNNFNFPASVRNAALHASNQSDLTAKLLNIQIAKNIESYYRTLSKTELEVFRYLNVYWHKFEGNIQIPIRNIMDRFNKSRRWVHKYLKRLYDNGLVYTTFGGYGRKITRRTFSERGIMVIDAIIKGFKHVTQDAHKKGAHYRAHYPGGDSNYISSKADIIQQKVSYPHKKEEPQDEKEVVTDPLRIKELLSRVRDSLKIQV